jgi:hypothetical protein
MDGLRFISSGGVSVTRFVQGTRLSAPKLLRMVRAGRWLHGYLDGALVGVIEVSGGAIQTLRVGASSFGNPFRVGAISIRELPVFLRSGSDRGSTVLPAAMPSGGLRGRYFNDGDLSGLPGAARRAQPCAQTSRTSSGGIRTRCSSGRGAMSIRPSPNLA